jgi:hypothetical protein
MHTLTSGDGTKIAYTRDGSGPSVVLVGGASAGDALAEGDRDRALELFIGVAGLPQDAVVRGEVVAVLDTAIADRPHTRVRRCVPERRVASPGSAVLDQSAGAAHHQGRAGRSNV